MKLYIWPIHSLLSSALTFSTPPAVSQRITIQMKMFSWVWFFRIPLSSKVIRLGHCLFPRALSDCSLRVCSLRFCSLRFCSLRYCSLRFCSSRLLFRIRMPLYRWPASLWNQFQLSLLHHVPSGVDVSFVDVKVGDASTSMTGPPSFAAPFRVTRQLCRRTRWLF